MKYQLSHKGFNSETIYVTVTPSVTNANDVDVVFSSDNGVTGDKWGNTYVFPKEGSFVKNQVSDECYFLEEGTSEESFDTNYNLYETISSEKLEGFLEDFNSKFYTFHKKQDEAANLTIQTIRNLRVEDIVGEQSWEVVKTTSRRGTRRG
jgi:hypothetical protein